MASAPDQLAVDGHSQFEPTHSARWTPAAIFQRALAVVRQQGLSALFFKTLGELGYRRVYVYKEILQNDLHLLAAAIPLSVRTLDEADLADYVAQASRLDRLEVMARLDAGHLCHAAWSDGKLVGYVWSAPGTAPIDYLGVAMKLPRGAVYGYELFVLAAYREAGASVAMIQERRKLLLDAGYDTGYSALMSENKAAVGFQRAVKRIPVGTMRVLWFGSQRYSWLRMNNRTAPQPFGIAH